MYTNSQSGGGAGGGGYGWVIKGHTPSTPNTPKSSKTPNSSGVNVFGFVTVPRNFRSSPTRQSPQLPSQFRTGSNTIGRHDGQHFNFPNRMSSFGGGRGNGRAEVVEGLGLVVNRFQRPLSRHQSINEGGNQVMHSEIYRDSQSEANSRITPRKAVSVSSPPGPLPPLKWTPPDYSSSSIDNSFEDEKQQQQPVSPNPDYQANNSEMSYHNNYPPALPENPPGRNKPPPEQKPSLLLTKDENQVIFDILGKGRQSLATAVVQLLVPAPPDQTRWQLKETGVVCLVRDTTKKSYFIQVYSLGTRSMVFRQEVYNQFEYEMNERFLTFEGDHFTVGIMFADPTEAGRFREGLDSKLEAKRQRRNERELNRRSRLENHSPASNAQPQYLHQHNRNGQPPSINGASTLSTTYNFGVSTPKDKFKLTKGKDKNKKVILRKEDIGKPMDFRHIQHVGWDPNKGFDLNGEVDDELKSFFEKAGVSSDALQDDETRKFIYNFIEENGGLETIKNSRPAAPPPPPQMLQNNLNAPPLPNRSGHGHKPAAPPPPPSRPSPPVPYNNNQHIPPPPPPLRTASTNIVPDRPSLGSGPARPPPPTFSPNKANTGQSNGAIPPPPPPPPPMPGFGAPPPPPMPMIGASDQLDSPKSTPKTSQPAVLDDRSNLLAAIQKGVQLKRVEPSGETPTKRGGSGGLADCLGQIQKGVGLKPVQQVPKEPLKLDKMDDLAGALARALQERSKAIHSESSSEGEEEELDDDEWES